MSDIPSSKIDSPDYLPPQGLEVAKDVNGSSIEKERAKNILRGYIKMLAEIVERSSYKKKVYLAFPLNGAYLFYKLLMSELQSRDFDNWSNLNVFFSHKSEIRSGSRLAFEESYRKGDETYEVSRILQLEDKPLVIYIEDVVENGSSVLNTHNRLEDLYPNANFTVSVIPFSWKRPNKVVGRSSKGTSISAINTIQTGSQIDFDPEGWVIGMGMDGGIVSPELLTLEMHAMIATLERCLVPPYIKTGEGNINNYRDVIKYVKFLLANCMFDLKDYEIPEGTIVVQDILGKNEIIDHLFAMEMSSEASGRLRMARAAHTEFLKSLGHEQ
jgi:hypoxanthine-guanine phosphoribosyltransferase